jgi:hypothetical protein
MKMSNIWKFVDPVLAAVLVYMLLDIIHIKKQLKDNEVS